MYERNQLLFLRQSPLSKTPPVHLPFIPGVTGKDDGSRPIPEEDEVRDDEVVYNWNLKIICLNFIFNFGAEILF